MKNNNTKKSILPISALFHDNRFLAVISLVVAFVIWVWISIEKSPEIQQVITDVPVQINLENTIPEQLGLQIFGESEFKVDVTVKGKKYIVASLDSDDIKVVANTNKVDSAGLWTLQLKASPNDNSDDFSIAATSSAYVEVYFDMYKEIEVALEGIVETKLTSYVPDGCIAGDVVLSKNTVLLSGPATEINRVAGVSATATVDSVLEKTTTFDTDIVVKTNDGIDLQYTKINTGDTDITMAIPVLKVVTLPTAIEFKNTPSYFIKNPLNYTVYPANVKVAVPVDMIDTVTEFVVSTIDFADISAGINTFRFDTNQVSSTFKISDESVKKFTIKIDASQMVSRTISVPISRFGITHTRDDYDVSINQDKDIIVKLVGLESDVENITADDLIIEADTTEMELSESVTAIPGNIRVVGDSPCWAVGEYDIKVSVKQLS